MASIQTVHQKPQAPEGNTRALPRFDITGADVARAVVHRERHDQREPRLSRRQAAGPGGTCS